MCPEDIRGDRSSGGRNLNTVDLEQSGFASWLALKIVGLLVCSLVFLGIM